eukprot:8865934-Alexandrium_andersonii.AAC.1
MKWARATRSAALRASSAERGPAVRAKQCSAASAATDTSRRRAPPLAPGAGEGEQGEAIPGPGPRSRQQPGGPTG